VLNKRHVSLGEIFRNNGWLMAFVLYCFLAIAWSDFPFAAFKRWIKVLGHPVMVLILFTEPDPEESLTRLMKRSAYVLLPFSILFIKYFEGIGRQFDDWTGAAHNTGVAQNKNGLGGLCMVLGFFFFWRLLKTWRSERSTARRNELQLIAGLLFMIGYLLRKAHSATSFLGLLIAMLIMLLLNLRSVNKRLIGAYVLLAIVTLGVAELAFGIFEHIVDLTGHSDTINGRAELWHELLAFNASPIFGAGFESFWLGDRLRKIWETHWWHPTQAHNGYLETYLNLGVVGLLMLVGLIVATFLKIRTALLRNFEWGRFRLGLFIAIVLYNWTEAAFRGLSLIWFAFYIIAMEYPSLRFASMEPSPEATGSEEELELAYSEERI
jgi:exopolysaccharide production protein ExoQ